MKVPDLTSTAAVLLAWSLGLGIISLGKIAGADIRIWQIALLVGTACGVVQHKGKLFFPSNAKTLLLLLCTYLGTIFLSTVSAIDSTIALKRGIQSILLICLLFTPLLLRLHNRPILVSKAIIFSSVTFAVLGILDVFLYSYANQLFQTFHSLDSSNQGGFAELSGYGSAFRARGFHNEANEFTQFLLIPFAFILAWLKFGQTSRSTRTILFFGLSLVSAAQFYTYSRTGLIIFLLQFFLLISLGRSTSISLNSKRKSIWKLRLFWVVTMPCLIFIWAWLDPGAFALVVERINSLFSGSDYTFGARLRTTLTGFQLGGETWNSLLFGIGAGNLDISQLSEATTTNAFVDIFSETGLPSLFIYVACLWVLHSSFSVTWRTKRSRFDAQQQSLLAGSYLSFFGLVLGGITYATHNLFFFWFIMGLLLSSLSVAPQSSSPFRNGLGSKKSLRSQI